MENRHGASPLHEEPAGCILLPALKNGRTAHCGNHVFVKAVAPTLNNPAAFHSSLRRVEIEMSV
jgi:hypothetical protein